LRPCNHAFCGECVRTRMTSARVISCAVCGQRAQQCLGFAGPMNLPGQEVVDVSNAQVI
ncbi:hypothetical protein EJ06DRAFT_450723, partial [Trichodelitschia bisporula]